MSYKSIQLFFERKDTKSLRRYKFLNFVTLRRSDLAFKIRHTIAIGNLSYYLYKIGNKITMIEYQIFQLIY